MMKKTLLFTLVLSLAILASGGLNAQVFKGIPSQLKNFKVERPAFPVKDQVGAKPVNTVTASKSVLDDPSLMTTQYDMQTNASTENRIYYYPDGTIGAVATMAHQDNFSDRGTGYNYFDGTAWGAPPDARLENERVGWPSYTPLGANGEIVVSHTSSAGLKVLTRPEKGTGTWTQTILAGPVGAVDISWPRVITSGPDRNIVHIICLTYVAYQDLNLALLYYRSQDGGQTWDIQGQILDGMTSADYLGFGGDSYSWAAPVGNTIAFTIGDSWYDQFIMKSTDNGTSWTKTKIWSCLYNKYVNGPNDTTPTFYCPDGSNAIALDATGKAHVVFGLQRAKGDSDGKKWYPFTDGLVYWNENMGELPQALDPDTLFNHGNLIGWVQDTNVFYAQATELAYYYVSLSSHPTLTIDEYENMYCTWSGVTTLRDPNSFMLRHIFGRASTNGGLTWKDNIVDLTGDFLYTWSECVYPSASPTTSGDKLFLEFQADAEAGVYLNGSQGAQGQTSITTNDIIFLNPTKDSFYPVGINNKQDNSILVSQNYPNPVKDHSVVNVNLKTSGNLSLTVTSVVGQQIMNISKGYQVPGSYQFTIDGSQLTPGIYFYTVTAGKSSVTKKMIVE
jgi:hypothetical protein